MSVDQVGLAQVVFARMAAPHAWGAQWQEQQGTECLKRQAGCELYRYLVAMYAGSRPMTATDLCIIAYWAKESGAQGDVQKLSLDPKKHGGGITKSI